ncbi:substrate-binding periplasmic protein [Zooshikella ganghwensis]|nr:transporter substrate-binding domain-containing protein [Zooshikella ganghwensis]
MVMPKYMFFHLLFYLSALQASDQEQVVLANGEWLPYLSKSLKHYGVGSHIVTESFAEEGVAVKYVFLPWKRAYESSKKGKYHGTLIWSPSDERKQLFLFSDSVVDGTSVLFKRKSHQFEWQTYEDLTDYRIGGLLGYVYQLEDNPNIGIIRVRTEIEAFKMLAKQHIDIFPSDLDVGYATLHESLPEDVVSVIDHHLKPYNVTSYHLIISKKVKNAQALIDKFNKGLSKLKMDGRYDRFFQDSRMGRYHVREVEPIKSE